MEKYIENIELINKYINGELTQSNKQAFENQLKIDAEFNALYNEQITIIKGIERIQLKAEIVKAHQSYVRNNRLKYLGLLGGIIIASVLVYTFFFNTETPKVEQLKENNIVEIVSDSTEVDVASEENNILIEKVVDSTKKKYTVIKKITKKVEVEELTRRYGGVVIVKDTVLVENLGSYTGQELEKQFPDFKHLKPKKDTIVINVNSSSGLTGSAETYLNKEPLKTEVVLTNKTEKVVEGIEHDVSPESLNKELAVFFKSVKKAPQVIKINTEKKVTITCKEGTKLTIPAKAFIDAKTGKLARGTINLEVTEYYKLSDMLLGNLTTKSNDKQLETGGMLYLQANKKGQKLKLESSKRITIAFPNKKKTSMQLFLGEEVNNGVNWKLNSQPKTETSDTRLIKGVIFSEEVENIEVPFNLIEKVPVYPGCKGENNFELQKCTFEAISSYIDRNFDSSIAVDLGLTGSIKLITVFKIDQEGEIVNITVRTPRERLGNEMIRVLESMPKLEPGTQRGIPVIVPYSFPLNISVSGKTRKYNTITVKSVDKNNSEIDRLISKDSVSNVVKEFSGSKIANYVFSTLELGWINCDRFTRTRAKKIKYKFKIKDADGANIKMVFKSISSILSSRKYNATYDFGRVPKNEAVVLVTIKKVDDKLYLGLKETKTEEVEELDIPFKEVSLKELKEELMTLNKDFN